MYVVILTFDLIWLYFYRDESSVGDLLVRPPVLATVFVVTPLLAAATMWYRRRPLRELRNLTELKRVA